MKSFFMITLALFFCANLSAAAHYSANKSFTPKAANLPTRAISCTDVEKKSFSKYMKYNSALITSWLASDLFKKESISYMTALAAGYGSKADDAALCTQALTTCSLATIPKGGIDLFNVTCADGTATATIEKNDCDIIF